MNTISRTISGIAAFALGLFILYATIAEGSDIWSLIWGIASGALICGIGVYLLFNKKEDDIDEIKDK